MKYSGSALCLLALGVVAFASPVALAAPSVEMVLAANKAATGTHPAGRPVLRTLYSLSAYGMQGDVNSFADQKHGWSLTKIQLGPQTTWEGYDGGTSWDRDTSGAVVQQVTALAKSMAVRNAYQNRNGWWLPDFGGAKITVSEQTENGKTYAVLNVTPQGGEPFTAWFDESTHLLSRIVQKQDVDTETTYYSDYARHDGVEIAGKVTVDAGKGKAYLVHSTLRKAIFETAYPQSFYGVPKFALHDFAMLGGKSATTLPIRLINNHIYGQVSFNGHAPVTAIFDTGGLNLVTPEVAKKTGLKVEGNLPMGGVGKGVMQAGISHVKTIRIGDAEVQNQQILILPLDQLSPVEGAPMPAMIGYGTFRRFITTIDYAAGKMTLTDPKHFDPKDAGTPVPFVINGRIPQIKGQIEGIPAVFDIDTGSRSEISITAPSDAAHHFSKTHKGVKAVTGWGVGGPNEGYALRLKRLHLGPVAVDNVVADVALGAKGAFASKGYDGNVGSGLLKRFIVTFDYDHHVLYLKKQPLRVADTGTFDRSGLWINQGKNGFEIFNVAEGSPAAVAGLKAGDVITGVYGHPAASIRLSDLRMQLRDLAPGTMVVFSVLHKGARRPDVMTIILKDQI